MSDSVKTKRGRPTEIVPKLYSQYRNLFPEIKTRRGILNLHYRLRAFGIIKNMAENENVKGLEYLVDPINETMNDTVLMELGRWNDDDIKELAVFICESQSKEKKSSTYWRQLLTQSRLSETVSENN